MKPNKKKKVRKVKAWMFLTEKDELIGEGQESHEFFYTKEAALQWQREFCEETDEMSTGTKFIKRIFAGWKLVPCIITLPPKKK